MIFCHQSLLSWIKRKPGIEIQLIQSNFDLNGGMRTALRLRSHSRSGCTIPIFCWNKIFSCMLLIKHDRKQTSVWTIYDHKATGMCRRRMLKSHSKTLFMEVIMDIAAYGSILKFIQQQKPRVKTQDRKNTKDAKKKKTQLIGSASQLV